MGWKGTLRSIVAMSRRMERESLRRQRELERQRQQYQKMQELEQAKYEVQVYENHIDVLTSLHKECSDRFEWDSLTNKQKPVEPTRQSTNEDDAIAKVENFKPSGFDKLFSRSEKRLENLKAQIPRAKSKDERQFLKAKMKYEDEYEEWKELTGFSLSILDGDINAYAKAITDIDPFSEIHQIGSEINFEVIDSRLIVAALFVNNNSVIPKDYKTVLKSGKLSIRKLSKTKFFELYQDYVCSAVLRVSRELFALLPINMIVINAIGELLNTSTGYFERQPILSVLIPRDTLERLNFELLDPSDSLDNFVHNMSFKQTKGFSPIDVIDPAEIDRGE